MVKLAKEVTPLFAEFCTKLGIEPTQRQFRAWKRGDGVVHAAAIKEAGHNRRVRAAMIAQGVWR